MANIFDDNSEFKKYLEHKAQGKSFDLDKVVKKVKDFKKTDKPKADTVLHIENEPKSTTNKIDTDAVKKAASSPSAYKLDLSSHAVKPRPVTDEPQAQAKAKPEKPKKERSSRYNFVVENLKTFLYGTIIFLVGYIALNFSAYKEVGINFYYDLINAERGSVLTTFTDPDPTSQNTETPTLPTAIASEPVSSVPPFNMEITPPGTRIIIPRLNKNVPVVDVPEDNLVKQDWSALENDLQNALRGGVVHYPGTPWPGQSGNVVITGHSSYYPWDPGRFKDVFAVLHNVKIGDEIIVFHNQRKYRYQVTESSVVLPQQVEVLADTGDNRITLLTCTPIGTNLKRLIVTAKPV